MSERTSKIFSMPTCPRPALRRGQRLLGILLSIAALVLTMNAWGQIEAESGYVSPHDPVNEYLDAIDRIEVDHGPYATELSDLFLGLGQTLIDLGEYERARDAFHRGVLVVRVNSGPNSPEQTNHLYLLANIETALGETETADKILHNIYFVNSEFYGRESLQMLPVLDRIYQWYEMTRPLGTPYARFSNYKQSIEVSREMIWVSERALGENHPETAAAFRRLAGAQFQTARFLKKHSQEPDVYRAAEYTASDYFEAGNQNYRNYLEILQALDSTTPLEFAEALADLGDWYLMFPKGVLSRSLYQQGYRLLTESELPAAAIENYMNQPRAPYYLTDEMLMLPNEGTRPSEELNLDLSMTVTKYGDIREVEVVKAPRELSEDEIELIRDKLKSVRFRPAMKEGKIVTTQDFIWQYAIAMGEAS
jgi:tetratricopeptide (TPR) repeat protein